MTSLHSNGNPDPGEKRNHRMDEVRGGFVLKAKSDEEPVRRNSLVEKTKKGLLSVSEWNRISKSNYDSISFFAGIEVEKATQHQRFGKTRNGRIGQHTVDSFDGLVD